MERPILAPDVFLINFISQYNQILFSSVLEYKFNILALQNLSRWIPYQLDYIREGIIQLQDLRPNCTDCLLHHNREKYEGVCHAKHHIPGLITTIARTTILFFLASSTERFKDSTLTAQPSLSSK